MTADSWYSLGLTDPAKARHYETQEYRNAVQTVFDRPQVRNLLANSSFGKVILDSRDAIAARMEQANMKPAQLAAAFDNFVKFWGWLGERRAEANAMAATDRTGTILGIPEIEDPGRLLVYLDNSFLDATKRLNLLDIIAQRQIQMIRDGAVKSYLGRRLPVPDLETQRRILETGMRDDIERTINMAYKQQIDPYLEPFLPQDSSVDYNSLSMGALIKTLLFDPAQAELIIKSWLRATLNYEVKGRWGIGQGWFNIVGLSTLITVFIAVGTFFWDLVTQRVDAHSGLKAKWRIFNSLVIFGDLVFMLVWLSVHDLTFINLHFVSFVFLANLYLMYPIFLKLFSFFYVLKDLFVEPAVIGPRMEYDDHGRLHIKGKPDSIPELSTADGQMNAVFVLDHKYGDRHNVEYLAGMLKRNPGMILILGLTDPKRGLNYAGYTDEELYDDEGNSKIKDDPWPPLTDRVERDRATREQIRQNLAPLLDQYPDRVFTLMYHEFTRYDKPFVYQAAINWLCTGNPNFHYPDGHPFPLWEGINQKQGRPVDVITGVFTAAGTVEPITHSSVDAIRYDPNLGRSRVKNFLVKDIEIDVPAQEATKLFMKMNDPASDPWTILQPRVRFRNEDDSLRTLAEAFAQKALWFNNQAIMGVHGEVRGSGKFGIKVDQYYNQVVRPSINPDGSRSPGRYFEHAVQTSEQFRGGVWGGAGWAASMLLLAGLGIGLFWFNLILGLIAAIPIFLLAMLITSFWPTEPNTGTPRAIMSHDEYESNFAPMALVDDVLITDAAMSNYLEWVGLLYKWSGNFDAFTLFSRFRRAIHYGVSSRFFNNLVLRGLVGTALFSIIFIAGGFAVNLPGVEGIRIPFLAEFLYGFAMIILLHDKDTSPTIKHISKVGRLPGALMFAATVLGGWFFPGTFIFVVGIMVVLQLLMPNNRLHFLYSLMGLSDDLSSTGYGRPFPQEHRLARILLSPFAFINIALWALWEAFTSTLNLLPFMFFVWRFIKRGIKNIWKLTVLRENLTWGNEDVPKNNFMHFHWFFRTPVIAGLSLLFLTMASGWMPYMGLGWLQLSFEAQRNIMLGLLLFDMTYVMWGRQPTTSPAVRFLYWALEAFLFFAIYFFAPFLGAFIDQHWLMRGLTLILTFIGGGVVAYVTSHLYTGRKTRPVAAAMSFVVISFIFIYFANAESIPGLAEWLKNVNLSIFVFQPMADGMSVGVSPQGLGRMLGTNPLFMALHAMIMGSFVLYLLLWPVTGLIRLVRGARPKPRVPAAAFAPMVFLPFMASPQNYSAFWSWQIPFIYQFSPITQSLIQLLAPVVIFLVIAVIVFLFTQHLRKRYGWDKHDGGDDDDYRGRSGGMGGGAMTGGFVRPRDSKWAAAASLGAGGIALAVHSWVMITFGWVPVVIFSVSAVLAINRQKKSMPLWLEAVLKASLVFHPLLGAAFMTYQASAINRAKEKANAWLAKSGKNRGADLPTKAELEALKARLGIDPDIQILHSTDETNEVAYVLPHEAQDRIIRIDYRAFTSLPLFLQRSILKDHEIAHFASPNEIPAYTRQILNAPGKLFGAAPQTIRFPRVVSSSRYAYHTVLRGITVILIAAILLPLSIIGQGRVQFARDYRQEELLNDSTVRERFINEVLIAEAKFHQAGVGYNDVTGLTYDGHSINFETGELIGAPRMWSAASKESIHVMLLALAISGSTRAQLFISPDNPAAARAKALDILAKKMTSYEKFNREYPGFGGFLPWFLNQNAGMRPTDDWQNRVPGLDNGMLAWSLFLAADVHAQQGNLALGNRYRNYWQLMARNAPAVFYDASTGKVRAEARIGNTRAAPATANYSNNQEGYWLDDPYEGELLVLFMSCFSNMPQAQIDRIWQEKSLVRSAYRTQDGQRITVRQGHWYSSHEMLNSLIAPYIDDPLIRRVLALGEKARTWHSAENGIPGLFASTHEPVAGNVSPLYVSEIGVPSIAAQAVERQDIVAPYAAFPVIAMDEKTGIAWYQTMLSGPKMQGPYGATESAHVNGQRIAPLLTWDGKDTTILAIVGNSTQMMGDALKRASVYTRFIQLIGRKYRSVFGSAPLEGEDLPFRTPTAAIPLAMPDFSPPSAIASIDVLEGTEFQGQGELFALHMRNANSLVLPAVRGYIWNSITPVDVKANPWITLNVQTAGGGGRGIYIEIKNTDDTVVSGERVRIEFPNTGGQHKLFSINMGPLLKTPNTRAAIFAYSDPEVIIDFQKPVSAFTAQMPAGSQALSWDGRRFGIVQGAVAAAAGAAGTRAALNLLDRINFVNTGLNLRQDRNLIIGPGNGFAWALVPPTLQPTLTARQQLSITVKSDAEAEIWLELKNTDADEKAIAQTELRFGVPKIKVQIPNTNGQFRTIQVPLQMLPGVRNKRLKVIAISDPSGARVEISDISFPGSSVAGNVRPFNVIYKGALAWVLAGLTGLLIVIPGLAGWDWVPAVISYLGAIVMGVAALPHMSQFILAVLTRMAWAALFIFGVRAQKIGIDEQQAIKDALGPKLKELQILEQADMNDVGGFFGHYGLTKDANGIVYLPNWLAARWGNAVLDKLRANLLAIVLSRERARLEGKSTLQIDLAQSLSPFIRLYKFVVSPLRTGAIVGSKGAGMTLSQIQEALQISVLQGGAPYLNLDQISEILRLIESGKLSQGEIVDVINSDDRVITSIGRDIAHAYGIRHRTANILIRTPEGKFIFQVRAHHKKAYPYGLSAYGGHLLKGETYDEARNGEMVQELGFADGYKLKGQFVSLGQPGSFKSPDWDRKNIDLRSWDVYEAPSEEVDLIRKNAAEVEEYKKSHTRQEFEDWLVSQAKSASGRGEVYAVVELSLDEVVRIASQGHIEIPHSFVDGIQTIRSQPSADSLGHFIGQQENVELIKASSKPTDLSSQIETMRKEFKVWKNWALSYAEEYKKTHPNADEENVQLVGKTIVQEIEEDIYEPLLMALDKIEKKVKSREIDPTNVTLKLSRNGEEGKIGFSREARVASLAMKGNPWQMGHLFMALEAIGEHGMDKIILIVDNGDPRKLDLSTLTFRDKMTIDLVEKLSPFVEYSQIFKDEFDLDSYDGERAIFRLSKWNKGLNVKWFHFAGSDHRPWFTAAGKPDVAQKMVLGMTDAGTLANQDDAYFGQNMGVIFSERPGKDRFDRTKDENGLDELDRLQALANAYLAEHGLSDKNLEILTIFQFANTSSTRIREKGHWWTVPKPIFEQAEIIRLAAWGYQDNPPSEGELIDRDDRERLTSIRTAPNRETQDQMLRDREQLFERAAQITSKATPISNLAVKTLLLLALFPIGAMLVLSSMATGVALPADLSVNQFNADSVFMAGVVVKPVLDAVKNGIGRLWGRQTPKQELLRAGDPATVYLSDSYGNRENLIIESKRFPDGEILVWIPDYKKVQGMDVQVVQKLRSSSDVIHSILVLDTLRRYGAKKISLSIRDWSVERKEDANILRILRSLSDEITVEDDDDHLSISPLPSIAKKPLGIWVDQLLYIDPRYESSAKNAALKIRPDQDHTSVPYNRLVIEKPHPSRWHWTVKLPQGMAGKNVVLLHTTETNDKLLELLLVLCALRDQNVGSISLLNSYEGYSRQDEAFVKGQAISAVTMLELINRLTDHHAAINVHYGSNEGLVSPGEKGAEISGVRRILNRLWNLLTGKTRMRSGTSEALFNVNGFIIIAERMFEIAVREATGVDPKNLDDSEKKRLGKLVSDFLVVHPIVLVAPDDGAYLYAVEAARVLEKRIREEYGVEIKIEAAYLDKVRVGDVVNIKGPLLVQGGRRFTPVSGNLQNFLAFVLDDETAQGSTILGATYALVHDTAHGLGLPWQNILAGVVQGKLNRGFGPFRTGLKNKAVIASAKGPREDRVDHIGKKMPPRMLVVSSTLPLNHETPNDVVVEQVDADPLIAFFIKRVLGQALPIQPSAQEQSEIFSMEFNSPEELRPAQAIARGKEFIQSLGLDQQKLSGRFVVPSEAAHDANQISLKTVVEFMLEELIKNWSAHASILGARKFKVKMQITGSKLAIVIEDDGKGFDIEKIGYGRSMNDDVAVETFGRGLWNLRESFHQLGIGTLTVNSKGKRIIVSHGHISPAQPSTDKGTAFIAEIRLKSTSRGFLFIGMIFAISIPGVLALVAMPLAAAYPQHLANLMSAASVIPVFMMAAGSSKPQGILKDMGRREAIAAIVSAGAITALLNMPSDQEMMSDSGALPENSPEALEVNEKMRKALGEAASRFDRLVLPASVDREELNSLVKTFIQNHQIVVLKGTSQDRGLQFNFDERKLYVNLDSFEEMEKVGILPVFILHEVTHALRRQLERIERSQEAAPGLRSIFARLFLGDAEDFEESLKRSVSLRTENEFEGIAVAHALARVYAHEEGVSIQEFYEGRAALSSDSKMREFVRSPAEHIAADGSLNNNYRAYLIQRNYGLIRTEALDLKKISGTKNSNEYRKWIESWALDPAYHDLRPAGQGRLDISKEAADVAGFVRQTGAEEIGKLDALLPISLTGAMQIIGMGKDNSRSLPAGSLKKAVDIIEIPSGVPVTRSRRGFFAMLPIPSLKGRVTFVATAGVIVAVALGSGDFVPAMAAADLNLLSNFNNVFNGSFGVDAIGYPGALAEIGNKFMPMALTPVSTLSASTDMVINNGASQTLALFGAIGGLSRVESPSNDFDEVAEAVGSQESTAPPAKNYLIVDTIENVRSPADLKAMVQNAISEGVFVGIVKDPANPSLIQGLNLGKNEGAVFDSAREALERRRNFDDFRVISSRESVWKELLAALRVFVNANEMKSLEIESIFDEETAVSLSQ